MKEYQYLKDHKVKITGAIHVGAHRAEELDEHTALGAKKIIWVEANPDVFLEMINNLEGSGVENYPFCYACCEIDDQEVEFNIVYGDDAGYMTGNKGCSSLLKPIGRMEPWHRRTIQADTITLDSLISRNDLEYEDYQLLEIDVQGSEFRVLQGAIETLKHIKYVSLEVTFSNPDYEGVPDWFVIQGFLNMQGFFHKETFMRDEGWGDALFAREGIGDVDIIQ